MRKRNLRKAYKEVKPMLKTIKRLFYLYKIAIFKSWISGDLKLTKSLLEACNNLLPPNYRLDSKFAKNITGVRFFKKPKFHNDNVDLDIAFAIQEGANRFNEIAKKVGGSKTTFSQYLKELIREGILEKTEREGRTYFTISDKTSFEYKPNKTLSHKGNGVNK